MNHLQLMKQKLDPKVSEHMQEAIKILPVVKELVDHLAASASTEEIFNKRSNYISSKILNDGDLYKKFSEVEKSVDSYLKTTGMCDIGIVDISITLRDLLSDGRYSLFTSLKYYFSIPLNEEGKHCKDFTEWKDFVSSIASRFVEEISDSLKKEISRFMMASMAHGHDVGVDFSPEIASLTEEGMAVEETEETRNSNALTLNLKKDGQVIDTWTVYA